MKLANIDPGKILFLDIETVSEKPEYGNLSERMQKLWDKKARRIAKNEDDTPQSLYQSAGIYAEFGKIIVISVGYFAGEEFRLTSFYGDDEKKLLESFASMLNAYFATEHHYLCAHNGKEFDFPYIARRMLINGIPLPGILNTPGKKPWEVKHLDTLELWKFGDYKHYTSLDLLTAIFDIPTPKDDISGADVGYVYWQENELERIVSYCEKDTLAVAQLYLRYRTQPLIKEENIKVIKQD
ncbi:MAG: 3'-5' exonuclease [Bacteroidales bacterium]|nr:3'-5' exonuclease [Bacteroidales bacterium]MCF8326830.1 3'-5' exonuclease [Bacteroidales bacterium]